MTTYKIGDKVNVIPGKTPLTDSADGKYGVISGPATVTDVFYDLGPEFIAVALLTMGVDDLDGTGVPIMVEFEDGRTHTTADQIDDSQWSLTTLDVEPVTA